MKHYFTALETPAIDAEKGIIRTVSLIEMGDAKGHFDKKGRQIIVDDTTLEQIFKECKKLGSIKVKADHGSGVFEIVGWADNFALTANKVTADIHLYESEPNRPRLLEIAEKNPTHMGVSMEFTGEDKPRGTVCMARCDGILAAALVDDPAANSSLFSVPSGTDEPEETETETNTNNMEDTTECMPSADDRLEKLEKMFEEFSSKFAKKFEDTEVIDPPATEKDDEPAGSDPEKTYEMPDGKEDEETKKIELACERAAELAVKKFAASVGVKQLGKPGAGDVPKVKEKHFEEHVVDMALKQFGGDTNKARAEILTNLSKYPEASKAYAASRNVKTA